MRELCIVPTYQREEFLYCCLEAIRKAEPEMEIHVFPDRGTDEVQICSEFGAIHHQTVPHSYHGNSYNVMEALKWVNQQSCGLAYIVEDDAIVDETFFRWARAALQSRPEAFAACGWRYSPDAPKQDGPDMLLPWYLSVCAALPRHSIESVVRHARPAYYADMKGYLDRSYPASPRRGGMHYEQDGLVLRVAESESRRCVWPRRPRAVHIGWHGYHSDGTPPEGTLEDRVKVVKFALEHPEVLMAMMNGSAAPRTGRCSSCDKMLLVTDDAIAVCVDCFHEKHPHLAVTSSSHYYFPSVL